MKRKSLILALASLLLAGCSSQGEAAANVAPTLVGVKGFQCVVHSRIDFLDGIAALDKEDGDITPNLEISISPTVEVSEGIATFDKVGEYTVNYKVADSQGKTVQKNVSVSVIERDPYTRFDLPQGFEGEVNGGASFDRLGMYDGKFVVEAHGHEVAEDVMVKKTFAMKTNLQYTFHFAIDARCEGKIKAIADGIPCSEARIEAGKSDYSFKHIVLDDFSDERDVEVALCFGGIDGKIDLTIEKLTTEYPQEDGKINDLTEGFTFKDRLDPRFENGAEGKILTEDNDQTAVLILTKPAPNSWEGGMFVNTGIEMKAGNSYEVSFDLERLGDAPYEVAVQRDKFDEYILFEPFRNPENGHHVASFTVTETSRGALWLFIQTGLNPNTIKLRNFKVEEIQGPSCMGFYAIEDYKEFHIDTLDCKFHSELGAFHYEVGSFSSVDTHLVVTSPSFYVKGSGGNYVLTFKARSSAPVEVVVAAPVSGGWEPTMMWERITLSPEETNYTFFLHGPGADRDYVIVWQFGSNNNTKYHDVDIEVEDVAISKRNAELDA